MSFWRNIAGLAVRRPDGCETCDCPPGLPGEDPAFTTAVTALGAKLAKADGRSQVSEFDAFSQVFQADESSERNIHRLYDLARARSGVAESALYIGLLGLATFVPLFCLALPSGVVAAIRRLASSYSYVVVPCGAALVRVFPLAS